MSNSIPPEVVEYYENLLFKKKEENCNISDLTNLVLDLHDRCNKIYVKTESDAQAMDELRKKHDADIKKIYGVINSIKQRLDELESFVELLYRQIDKI